MKVNEFIAKLNELGVSGDQQLCVSAMGGIGGSGREISNVSQGFDWDRGKILLHTSQPLEIHRKHYRYVDEATEKELAQIRRRISRRMENRKSTPKNPTATDDAYAMLGILHKVTDTYEQHKEIVRLKEQLAVFTPTS